MDSFKSECSEQCSPEVLGAIFSAVEKQQQCRVDWISALSWSPLAREKATDTQPVIKVMQHELLQDPAISHVLEVKKLSEKPEKWVMNKKTVKIKRLLHEWKRLFIPQEPFNCCGGEIYSVADERCHSRKWHSGGNRLFPLQTFHIIR